ncbi:hypothetical protein CDR68_08620 [Salmonella enterica]|uniref:Uncharacterized protein n=3 Tax=Salmonella enterica TaxID=28901 RepID=A0A5Y2QJR2_SALER|nr:hypothetical protein [Salmonella enterica subsp. arizonae]EBS7633867.1 hypothetical protein [Salmonella enterica]ECF5888516.1 hypothetical protein [Salmonella enterica subsp. indica]ECI8271373.1 hypothetical protein [Salmonella enterica subsp. enterica]EDR2770690.1 hypothetical protein [Salmonella enterica subsp. enterica serovar Oslo]HAE8104521.1 hypothetical protein [Salmonella enterica subsp. indica serovar 45:a:e,n,x]HAE8196299.1 hypothetical protein [Salmonella enterica subsp. indica 
MQAPTLFSSFLDSPQAALYRAQCSLWCLSLRIIVCFIALKNDFVLIIHLLYLSLSLLYRLKLMRSCPNG